MKNKGIKIVGDRIYCKSCYVEMRAPKHPKLKGLVFCPVCGTEALRLIKMEKPHGV